MQPLSTTAPAHASSISLCEYQFKSPTQPINFTVAYFS